MKNYDSVIIGPLSLDVMIDHHGNIEYLVGGAVIQSGYAAANTGHQVAVFTKLNPKDTDVYKAFAGCSADVYWQPSTTTTSIQNKYLTADQERRECHLLSACDQFRFEQLPPITSRIWHFAGLTVGDFDNSLIKSVAQKGKVAVDVQCLLRTVSTNNELVFRDWPEKLSYLPYIDYLKADAAEAAILTGTEDRKQAAKILHQWGASEIMITHNTEVLIYDGNQYYTCPIKAKNLSGRTGRGDTAFAGYINQRLTASIADSLLFCTALVSLKMETPGPFSKDRAAVQHYISQSYSTEKDSSPVNTLS